MIHIGIVDDHAVIRAGLREFLGGHSDMCVSGEATNGHEAINLVRRIKLDVLVMDLMMPRQNGQDVISIIKNRAPNLAVLILSGYSEELYAIALIRQGASGYLNKDCAPDVMVNAIRAVASGRHYFTPAVAELSLVRVGNTSSSIPHEQLTTREFQVFLRLARGKTNPVICDEISLSINSIVQLRRQLLRKMELRTNGELTYYAIKNRLID